MKTQDLSLLSLQSLQEIPKVELHRHLELSIRHSTLRELAPQFGINISDDQAFASRFLINEPMTDLKSVLNKFLDTQKLLASEEILERVAYEASEDVYHEGILISELRYAPTFIRDGHENLSFDQIHQAILRGVQRAEKDFPMAIGLICLIQRTRSLEDAEKVTQFAIEHKDTFLGLDLADNEEGFDSRPFAPCFLRAKKEGLKITIHAGELDKPESPGYVRNAINELGADRIGHGLHVRRDLETVNFVREKNVALELCLTSNWLTQAVPSLEAHPIRSLMEAGVQTTINTDDPGIFNININHEYNLLQKIHGFTLEEFKKCNEMAKEASFISEEKKNKVWPRQSIVEPFRGSKINGTKNE